MSKQSRSWWKSQGQVVVGIEACVAMQYYREADLPSSCWCVLTYAQSCSY